MYSFASNSKLVSFFVPTFLSTTPARASARRTGVPSLDGLRGIACFIVVNEHIFYNFSKTFLYGYGVINNFYVVQLPFIRILWCGLSMVNIFFVISGYVLSYKPLLYIHQGNPSAAQAMIASSTFRRLPRLYFPMWTSTLICGIMVWLGFFNRSTRLWELEDTEMKKNIYNFHEGLPLRFDSSLLLLEDVAKKIWHTLDIFTMTDHLIHTEHYDLHTWTIPVEFRCSMILFAVLSAISHFKMRYRIFVLTSVGTVVMMMKQKNTLMFLTGAIMSDVDHGVRAKLDRLKNDLSSGTTTRTDRFLATWLHPNGYIYPVLFTVGIYLLCVPTFFYAQDPFYSYLIHMVPLQSYNEPDVWLRYYGAVMVVWAVANSTKLKFLFVNPVSTYLGKVSFALYLVHGNVIRTLMYATIPTIYTVTGDGTQGSQTPNQMGLSMFMGWLLVIPLSIYLADLFMKGVDVPLTRLSRRVELAMSKAPKYQKPVPIY